VGLLSGLAVMGALLLFGPKTSDAEVRLIVEAATLTALTAVATVFVPWNRLPHWLQVTPPFVFLVVVFLVQAATDGATSSWGQLVLVPVVWLGVYGTPTEMVGALIGVGLTLAAPRLVPGNTPQQWREAFFLLGVSVVAGFGIQLFFARLRRDTERLTRMALTDHLTGVPNRRAWDEELEAALEEAVKRASPLTVAVLDVDRFKEYNDERGHQSGDRFLKEIAARWQAQLRETDVLARIGGDEFGIIFHGCRLEAAAPIARRLCEGLPQGRTCSAGIAEWNGRETVPDLTARADAALYRAKAAGRARIMLSQDGRTSAARQDHMTEAFPRLEVFPPGEVS
jgi:diguanylate cyclase (GGDEF)-like protein